MTSQRSTLAQQALSKSIQVRQAAGLDLKSPICVYDLCSKLGLKVQFVNFSMEGLYVKNAKPTILISTLRPFLRRNFTCAHEVGHHIFEHGFRVDEICEELSGDRGKNKRFIPEEYLADCFAGFLLMPPIGIRHAFHARGWDVATASALQFYIVACGFAVSYDALIVQMQALKIITVQKADSLRKYTPQRIRRELLGRDVPEPLLIIDGHWGAPTVDIETGFLLLLPRGTEMINDNLIFQADLPSGRLFSVNRPGLVQAHARDSEWAAFVRIARHEYQGLGQYRHMELPEEGDEDD